MKCLTPECQETKLKSRGLCYCCYKKLYQRVQRKTTTWGELIDKGLASRTTRKGASTEVRRKAQTYAHKRKLENDKVMDSLERKIAKKYLEQGYISSPGDMTPEKRVQYLEFLGLAGDTK